MAIMKRKNIKVDSSVAEKFEVNITADQVIENAMKSGFSLCPLDVKALAACFGIAIRSYPMEDMKSGYIKLEEGRWIIGVNSLHHPNRQRFTIAHELGHFMLHRDKIKDGHDDTILFRADGYGAPGMEREANLFAADLLMPESHFKELVKNFDGDAKKIAEEMGVSTLAVTTRAKSLGYGTSND